MSTNRIREFREAKRWSQTDLADELGMHWQTVQRAESGKVTLSIDKQRRYAAALGVSVDELFLAPQFRSVRIKGYVQAGHYAETWELPEDDQYDVPLPYDPTFEGLRLHGAELRGPSMNRRWPEGTALVFTDAIETQEDLVLGKRYIIERVRADGLREATVKTLWQDDSGKLWLLPESHDPRFQEPIPIEGAESDEIRIVGRVRFAVSRE